MSDHPPSEQDFDSNELEQTNVRLPKGLKHRVIRAAKWEGHDFASYVRSALLARVRQTERQRAKEEGEG